MNQANPLGTVSIAAARQYLKAAQAMGVDPQNAIDLAGLTGLETRADESRLDGADFQSFLHALFREAERPTFGLETGDFVEPGVYSVVGYITMSCTTLGEAIQRIAPYERLVGDMGITRVEQHGQQIHLIWHCAYPDPLVRAHLTDNVFASWINYARWLGEDETAAPEAVHLERHSPGPEWESSYRRRWRCPVSFTAPDNRVIVDASLLQRPLRHPDPTLRQTLEHHAQNRIATFDDEARLVTRARQAIRQSLLENIPRQDRIASDLQMTARTLQRRLSRHGLSYQQLLDEVRQSLAEEFLRDTNLAIPDIALRLGFSEPASFHRHFRNRVGMTPGEYRRQSDEEP